MPANQKPFLALSAFLLIALIVCLILNVVILTWGVLPIMKLLSAETILALLAAIYYAISGYKKRVAPAYKIYFTVLCLLFLSSGANMGIQFDSATAGITVCLMMIVFACIFTLLVATDLGKRKSMTLCCIVSVISFALMIFVLIKAPGIVRGGTISNTAFLVRCLSNLVLSLIATLMTAAKYVDKTARGTK